MHHFQSRKPVNNMYALAAITLLGALAYVQAGGIGLSAPVDGAAIIAGPSGTVKRGGGLVAPVITAPGLLAAPALATPGLISAAVAPGAVITGPGLAAPGLGLGLGLGLAAPGLALNGLALEGSGIEGQYVPDLTEKLYDDGSYKPGLYGH